MNLLIDVRSSEEVKQKISASENVLTDQLMCVQSILEERIQYVNTINTGDLTI